MLLYNVYYVFYFSEGRGKVKLGGRDRLLAGKIKLRKDFLLSLLKLEVYCAVHQII